MADYTMYSLSELRKLSKENFLKIRELEKSNEMIDVSFELSQAREQDVAIRDALAIKQEEKEVILSLCVEAITTLKTLKNYGFRVPK